MRVIEKRMLQAVAGAYDWKERNTEVTTNKNGVFVFLYYTMIAALVEGTWYFADGGYNTVTTSSRLRALGAEYSTNAKRNAARLHTQAQMWNLYRRGRLAA